MIRNLIDRLRRDPEALPQALIGIGAAVILVAERVRPLRPRTEPQPPRLLTNAVMGALAVGTIMLVERPVTARLAKRAEDLRTGVAQLLPGPAWVRDVAALILCDYAFYAWHVATHRAPWLWRLHLVHHVDLELDATTAWRFHAADMAVSTPFRAAQVAAIGVSPRALRWWRAWFFLSVLFHHSNIRLPERWERRLARVVTTPRMHGIHHTAHHEPTDSNWSSGLSWWDHLHGTFRWGEEERPIGVPAYRDGAELGPKRMLAMPFVRACDAWEEDKMVGATGFEPATPTPPV